MSEGAQATAVEKLLASFPETLAKALEKAIIAGRTAPVDPEKDKIKQERRLRMRKQMDENRKAELNRYLGCNHKRNTVAMNGTSTIAWAQQSDGVTRGVCQRCGCLFSPVLAECFDPKIHKLYDTVIRIPAGNADIQM